MDRLKKRASVQRRISALATTRASYLSTDIPYSEWLRKVFPRTFTHEMAPYHHEFWEWLWGLEPRTPTNPFVAVWPRGFSKTTNAEAAMVYAAAKGYRYGLYLKGVQDQADDAVSNIGARLESAEIERYYPALADRKVNKFGNSKGWRRNRLITASGFAVDALGLDVAKRGAKLEDFRPDFLIIDDIDEKHDTIATSNKKVATITASLIPALTPESAVLVVQNLIIPHGVVSRLAGVQPENVPPADFLSNRIVSGPHPAIEGLEYILDEQSDGRPYWRIVAGKPSWSYMNLDRMESELNRMGPTAFISEKQNEVADLDGGMFDAALFRHVEHADLPELEDVHVWLDPAVTATNNSDNQGLIVDARGVDGKLYRLHAWEGIETPGDVLKRAARKALEHKASTVGIETNQGGDLWRSAFMQAWSDLVGEGEIPGSSPIPFVQEIKVTAGDGPKRARWQEMLAKGYERGLIYHVIGTHTTLERALKRLPTYKPYDLADAAYLSWRHLLDMAPRGGYERTVAARRR